MLDLLILKLMLFHLQCMCNLPLLIYIKPPIQNGSQIVILDLGFLVILVLLQGCHFKLAVLCKWLLEGYA